MSLICTSAAERLGEWRLGDYTCVDCMYLVNCVDH
jgi:hypothetical protein